MIRRVLAAGVFFASISVAAQVGPSATDRVDARLLFDEALGLFSNGRYHEALAMFEESYGLRPKGVVLYNMANCQRALGDSPGAVASLEKCLSRHADEWSPTETQEIQDAIDQMRLEMGQILIRTSAPGIHVTIDGKEAGQTPLSGPLLVSPKRHTLDFLSLEGKKISRTVEVGPGALVEISIDELATPPSPPSEKAAHLPVLGEVLITGGLQGRIARIAGVQVADTPKVLQLAPGSYELLLIDREGRKTRLQTTVIQGQRTVVTLPPLPESKRIQGLHTAETDTAAPGPVAPPPPASDESDNTSDAMWATWILSAGVVATLVPALILGNQAVREYSAWKDEPSNDRRDKVETFMWSANGCFIASGAFALGAAIAGIVWAARANGESKTTVATRSHASFPLKGAFLVLEF